MNNNTIICIVGRTASGKDHIGNIISERLNIPMVVSYTTRPKRENEANGREHWFISDETADNMLRNNDCVLGYTKIGGVRYFGMTELYGKT